MEDLLKGCRFGLRLLDVEAAGLLEQLDETVEITDGLATILENLERELVARKVNQLRR